MSVKEEEKAEENQPKENEENEEEDVVDVELQKEMKGLRINESDFAKKEKNKKNKKKDKEEKKGKKKGQDFLDYANKNNIQINIEYEENKYQLKKTSDPKNDYKSNNQNDYKKSYNNRGGYRGGYKGKQRGRPQKYTGNKFDDYAQRMPMQGGYHRQRQSPKLVENSEILSYLEKIFGEENLNKDMYLRNRMKEDKIPIEDVVNYNDIKNNNIDAQKLTDVIKDSANLGIFTNEEKKNFIQIKNFDKLNLISMDQLNQNRKQNRMQKLQQYQNMNNAQQFPVGGYNYINMQNNYYFPCYPGFNQNPGYYQPVEYK